MRSGQKQKNSWTGIDLNRIWRYVAAGLIVVFLIAATGFVFWASDATPASDVALQAMQSDSQVFVSAENGWVVFFPAETPRPETGFVFYPGGRVDYRAYAPVLRLIAAQGYFVALLPVPLNLAMFDINAAARVQAAYPEIQDWFVGGHSLGGVAASSYAASHPDIMGVVLWASTPGNDSLKTGSVPVLSVYATNDGLFPLGMVEDSRILLPAEARFVAIEGGNHSQFGSYGLQTGDNTPGISPAEQWIQTANATVEFFQKGTP
jgi:pimeloyl-ACP methyl ester carboxylesterase